MQILEEQIFANALNLIVELGPVRLSHLHKYFGTWQKAWAAPAPEYVAAGIPDKLITEIIARKNKINPEQEAKELAKRHIEIILSQEPDYPQLLKEISAAPPLIYVRGNKKTLNNLSLGVVGTRKITEYGKLACEELVTGLVQNNITVVSGLAYGIDAIALNCVVANQGLGIAVLASDLDDASISPKVNFNLAQKIIQRGCLVSEYPIGANIQKQNFPIRNRIISGLSVGTIVVEADLDSGALITANYALEQNREVFAVPGSIFSPTSRGTNDLIRRGAHVVNNIGNVLEQLNLSSSMVSEPVVMEATPEENIILNSLTREPLHVEDLIRAIKLSPSLVNASLTILEMKGRIKNSGNGKYIKIR